MSIHFAPQWVKPIKPSGTSTTPTTDTPPNTLGGGRPAHLTSLAPPTPSSANGPSVPFPALGGTTQGMLSPSAATATSNASHSMTYSRATHTPLSPSRPGESSIFPDTDEGRANGLGFRYSKEFMLGLWDEDKVRDMPIELVQLLDDGRVLVSKTVQRPVGLREQTEAERRLLASSVHPPAVTRRQANNSNAHASNANTGAATGTANGAVGDAGVVGSNPQSANPARRSMAPLAAGGGVRDGSLAAGGRTAFGGFGRGEGGALGGGGAGAKFGSGAIGGGVQSPGTVGAEGRMPGALGGGFGGVGRRMGQRRNDNPDPAAGEFSALWGRPIHSGRSFR